MMVGFLAATGSEKDAYHVIINDSSGASKPVNSSSSATWAAVLQNGAASSNFAASDATFLLGNDSDSAAANDSLPVTSTFRSNESAFSLMPGLNMQQVVLVFLCVFILTMALFVGIVLKIWHAYQRCKAGRKDAPSKSTNGQRHKSPSKGRGHGSNKTFKNNFVARMIARIEEFDSLTPLVITPGSLIDDSASESGTSRSNIIPATSSGDSSGRIQRNYYAAAASLLRNGPLSPQSRGYVLTQKDLMAASTDRLTTDENQPLIGMPSPIPGEAPAKDGLAKVHTSALNGNARGGPIAIINQYLRNPFDDLDIISIDRTSTNSTLERNGKHTVDTKAAVSFYRAANHSSGSLQYHCSLSDYLPSEDYDYCPPTANNNGTNRASALPTNDKAGNTTRVTLNNLNGAKQRTIESVDKNHNYQKAKSVVRFLDESSLGNKSRRNYSPKQQRKHLTVDENGCTVTGAPKSVSNDSISSSLSSPVGSSIADSASMSNLDTTGSIDADLSDSNYNAASESDASECRYAPSTTSSIQAAFSSILNNNGNTGSSQPFLVPPPFSSHDRSGSCNSTTSEMELSPAEYESSTSHGSNVAQRRFQLHSIQEESEHDVHNIPPQTGAHPRILAKLPQLSTPSTNGGRTTATEDESLLSVLSHNGSATNSVSASPAPREEPKPSRPSHSGRLQYTRILRTSRNRYTLPILSIPPPPPQSSSGALLASMLERGKIKTGGLPSWFPRKEGLI